MERCECLPLNSKFARKSVLVLCVSVSPVAVVVVVCFAAILLTYYSTVLCLSVHVYLPVFMGLVG